MGVRLLLSPAARTSFSISQLQELISAYQEAFPELSIAVEVLVVSPRKIQALNKKHRQLDEPTDVLSFPTFAHFSKILAASRETEVLIGSIVICPEKAASYQEPLIDLVHHGLLHLLGFDHEEDPLEWRKEEHRLLSILQEHGLTIRGVPNDKI